MSDLGHITSIAASVNQFGSAHTATDASVTFPDEIDSTEAAKLLGRPVDHITRIATRLGGVRITIGLRQFWRYSRELVLAYAETTRTASVVVAAPCAPVEFTSCRHVLPRRAEARPSRSSRTARRLPCAACIIERGDFAASAIARPVYGAPVSNASSHAEIGVAAIAELLGLSQKTVLQIHLPRLSPRKRGRAGRARRDVVETYAAERAAKRSAGGA